MIITLDLFKQFHPKCMPLVKPILPRRMLQNNVPEILQSLCLYSSPLSMTKPILTVNPVGCFINNSRVDTSSALPVIPPLQHHFNQLHLICLLSAASRQHLWKTFCSTEMLMHRNKDTVFLLPSITQGVGLATVTNTLQGTHGQTLRRFQHIQKKCPIYFKIMLNK